jgi:outer membrane lipase/esterase
MILGRFAIGAVLAAALVACGGGTSQVEEFRPGKYVAFGDEASTITSNGRRYAVNVLNSAGDAVDCRLEPIWVQAVATQFGFVFAQCNPDSSISTNAIMRAAPGAKVADVTAQIDAQIAAGGFAEKDLVTVLAGVNDVLEQYATYGTRSEEQITAELRTRAERLAAQVNRLVGMGARVIISTIPDLGVTPYALQQKAAFIDTDRAALLTRLSAAFNARLRVTILNDGRFVGLVLADELTQSMSRFASVYGLTNATDALCTVALPNCTTATLVTSGTSSTYLWADSLQLTYAGQQRLGALAVDRAVGNPF